MRTLYLVRHAQASLGADDYDQLSPLGHQQSVQLGRHFAARNRQFDAVVSGSLKRHAQTLAGISEGMNTPLVATQWPALNEYDSRAVIAAVHPQQLHTQPNNPESYRQHFNLLRLGLTQWMLGKTQPEGMPSWPVFQQAVVDVLSQIRCSEAQQVLLVSSGGPIASAVGHVLATPPDATVELNMRLRNSAVTEFTFNSKRHALQTYNTLPHLDTTEFDSWITHA